MAGSRDKASWSSEASTGGLDASVSVSKPSLVRADSCGWTARALRDESLDGRTSHPLSGSAGGAHRASESPGGSMFLVEIQRPLRMTVSVCLMQAGTTSATQETADRNPLPAAPPGRAA